MHGASAGKYLQQRADAAGVQGRLEHDAFRDTRKRQTLQEPQQATLPALSIPRGHVPEIQVTRPPLRPIGEQGWESGDGNPMLHEALSSSCG